MCMVALPLETWLDRVKTQGYLGSEGMWLQAISRGLALTLGA